MMEKKQYCSIKAIRRIAKAGFGKTLESKEQAEEVLMRDYSAMAATGIVEIVRRLNQVISVFSRGESDESEGGNKRDIRPDHAKKFSGKSVGDFVYNFANGFECGLIRSVIIAMDDEGYARVALTHYMDNLSVDWAVEWDFATEEEAFANVIEGEIKCHEPMLANALEAKAALESGGDMSKWRDGFEV